MGEKLVLWRDAQGNLSCLSDLRMGEKLVPGDGPIIDYRRIRRALQEEAGMLKPERRITSYMDW